MREEIIGTIPQANDDIVLEVALMHDDAGQTAVELRYLVWGDGLGWYRQQTLTVDGTTASHLLCRLSSVRHRLRPKADPGRRDNVLPFPRRRPQPMHTDSATTCPVRGHREVRPAGGQG
jgi:hypothetical protein